MPWLAAALLLSKALQFALDSRPLLFPDSGSLVLNALKLDFQPHRSYVYSWLIRWFCVPFHSLVPVVAIQALAAAVVAWLLAFALMRFLGVRWQIAAAVALALAWDPTQVAAEHLVMTEAVAALIAALFLATALEYLREPRNTWLILLAPLGMMLVALRLVYVPMVFAFAVLVPVMAGSKLGDWRRIGTPLLLSLATVLACQLVYQRLTGFWAHREPAYEYRTGLFLAGNLAPLLKPEDAPDPQTAAALREPPHISHALSDASPDGRNFQLWDANGLISRLKQAFPDIFTASEHAEAMALHAVRRDPLGFLALGYRSWCDYRAWFPKQTLMRMVLVEDGADPNVQPNERAQQIIAAHFVQRSPYRATDLTLTRRYHKRSWLSCWMEYLAPFLGLAATLWAPSRTRRFAALLALWSAALLAVTCLTTPTQLRYLHPLAFPALAALAILAERLCRVFLPPATLEAATSRDPLHSSTALQNAAR